MVGGRSGAGAGTSVATRSGVRPASVPGHVLPVGTMPLVEHLYELRRRLAISLLAVTVAAVVCFLLWEPLYALLRQPYCSTPQGSRDCHLFSLGLFDQFKVRMRVAAIGGVIASSPVWLYQLGAFITPGLHKQERRYALGFLLASLAFFLMGCVFAFLTIAHGLQFLLTIGGGGVVTLLSVQSYLSFITLCLVAFGVAFEFPVLVLFLHVVGVLSADRLRRSRRGVIFGIAVGAAVITPSQDPVTFLAMALPLWVFYELCIVIARVRERLARTSAPAAADDEPAPLAPSSD